MSRTARLKEQAHKLVDGLPEGATWDDLMYEIYVRQSVEAGFADADAGRVTSVDDVRESFGLSRWRSSGLIPRRPSSERSMRYIAQSSQRYALQMVDRITNRSKQIGQFPRSGRMVPEFSSDTIREVFEGSYRII